MVNFPTQIPDCDSHSSALLNLFISYASICSAMASPPLWNSDVAEFPLTFQQTQNNSMAYEYSHADWDSLCDHLRDIPWDGIFNPVLVLLLVNFVSGFMLEIMYISLLVSICRYCK